MALVSALAHIDRAAFDHNVRSLIRTASPARVWVAIKANAYGHGMLELADVAVSAGADGLAVLDVPAALALRSSGITVPLFVWLHGVQTDFTAAVAANLEIGVSTREQLESAARAPGLARVHLKVDTGLHRNGFAVADWDQICAEARALQDAGQITVAGVWSHLADTSAEADAAARAIFTRAVETAINTAGLTPEYLHLAASSAAISEPESRFSLVRIGIAAYGISPFDDRDGRALGLRPVMSLTASVESVHGESATISAGWADGIPQVPSGVARVTINGVRHRVAQVEAHHMEIVVGSEPVTVGETAVIFGHDGPTAEEWAEWTGTIGDEIVTSVPSQTRRVSN
ncbi:MAG: putative alanine racemase [Actinomycetota bacterium]